MTNRQSNLLKRREQERHRRGKRCTGTANTVRNANAMHFLDVTRNGCAAVHALVFHFHGGMLSPLLVAVCVLLGAIFWWASSSGRTRWFPIIGNVFISSYFVPAGIVLIRRGRLDLIRVHFIAVSAPVTRSRCERAHIP